MNKAEFLLQIKINQILKTIGRYLFVIVAYGQKDCFYITLKTMTQIIHYVLTKNVFKSNKEANFF